jgi:hypothetical protein
LIKRPLVVVGGELTLENADLTWSNAAKFYEAPFQMKSNGGTLVIDDFGRQRVAPQDLLNRWIVPLESRVDFLTLQTGQKLEIPFVVLMAFATNIRPADLVDEAFLRRIHYKVFAESPTVAQFIRIFHNCCGERNVAFDRAVVDELLEGYYRPRKIPLRGCHPRDLIEQALSLAEYRGEHPCLTSELLRAACDSYFVDDLEPDPVFA